MSKPPTPSRIARAVAAKFWPDVQVQTKYAPGIFNFSCAGHGGLVAVLGEATFRPEHIELARKHGYLLPYAAVTKYRDGTGPVSLHLCESITVAAAWNEWADNLPLAAVLASGEVWVGEEDCEWATIAACSPDYMAGWEAKVRAGDGWTFADDAARDRYIAEFITGDYPRGVLSRWYPDFLADLTALDAPTEVDVDDLALV